MLCSSSNVGSSKSCHKNKIDDDKHKHNVFITVQDLHGRRLNMGRMLQLAVRLCMARSSHTSAVETDQTSSRNAAGLRENLPAGSSNRLPSRNWPPSPAPFFSSLPLKEPPQVPLKEPCEPLPQPLAASAPRARVDCGASPGSPTRAPG